MVVPGAHRYRQSPRCLGGVTTQNYYAVADDRTAYINPGGTGWRALTFAPANSKGLQSVFGTAPTNVWVGGDSGVVYRPGVRHDAQPAGRDTAR